MALDFSNQAVPLDFSSQGEPLDFSGMAVEETPAKNTLGTGLKDIARFLLDPFGIAAGLNAIGTGVGQKLAGGSLIEGLSEGAQKEELLGFGLNMETSAGKWVEEQLSTLFGKAREFGGTEAPKLLTNETARSTLKAIPSLAPIAYLYESLGDEGKTTMEAALSGVGAAGPEVLLTLLGGAGAKRVGKGIQEPELKIGDILKELEQEAKAPVEIPSKQQIGGLMKETRTPDDFARLQQLAPDLELEPIARRVETPVRPDTIDFEQVDPATLRTTTEDLFTPDMERRDFRMFATPEQGRDFVDTQLRDITQPKGEPGQFDLPGINQPLGGVGRRGFGQGGAIDPKMFSDAFQALMNKTDEGQTRVNASGESAASAEAISRLASQNVQGLQMYKVDPRTNTFIPLRTAERVDQRAGKGEAIIQRDASGKITVIDNQSDFNNEALINRSDFQLRKQEEQPAGLTGFGKGQRGSIGFRPEPESLEAKAKTLSKEDWTAEFVKQYPDKADFADRVYETLKPKQKASKPSDSGLMQAIDKGLGSLSTRIGNISQPLLFRSRQFEQRMLENTHKRLTAIDDFSVELNALDKPIRDLVDRAILNNDQATLDRMFTKLGGNFKENYTKARNALDEVGKELQSVGRLEGLRKDYFPRVVTDVDGLLNALGKENRTELQKRLLKAGTPLEENKIVNDYLRFDYKGPYKPGFSKGRTLDEVHPELQQFYASPTEAYHTYMRNATQEVETARFFGKDVQRDPTTKRVDVDKSIGALVMKELDDGNITIKQAEDLQDMLQARFGPGNRASNAVIQDLKNVGYMGLLGDAIAAATQLGDPAVSVYLNGLRPTLQAIASEFRPKNRKISMEDFGLYDHISEEFVNDRKSAKLLNTVFKAGLFTSVDKFGKNVVLNGALNQAQKAVKSPAGLKKFAEEWQPYFGEEFPQLVSDLQSGNITEPVRTLLFSKLSKVQPISKLEMPQKYLEAPNGRVFYMLKTFTLKQLDLMRNDALNQIKKGGFANTSRGLQNLGKYATVMGIAGLGTEEVKNWLLGRESQEKIPDRVIANIFKTFGVSEMVLQNLAKGELGKAALNVLSPPVGMYDDAAKDIKAALDMDDETEPSGKGLQRIPLIGRFLYNWGFGGTEEFNEKQEQRRMQQEYKEMVGG